MKRARKATPNKRSRREPPAAEKPIAEPPIAEKPKNLAGQVAELGGQVAKLATGSELNRLRDDIAKWSASFGESLHKAKLYLEDQHKILTQLGKHQEDMLRALVETRDVVRQLDGTLRALRREIEARTMLNYPPATSESVMNSMKPRSPEERVVHLENELATLKAQMQIGWPKT